MSYKEADRSKSISFSDLTLGVVQYLSSRNGVQDVKLEERSPAPRHELFLWEQKNYCSLPDDMRSFYLATDGFNLTWSAKVDTTVIEVGKMYLNKLQNIVRVGGVSGVHTAPCLTDLESESDSDVENDKTDTILERRQRCRPSFNIHKSHIFELDPCDGIGKVCLVYQAKDANSKADIWFLDRSLRWHYLAESFSTYYRLMLVNLGLPQWQYSFTDVGLSSQAKQWFHIYADVRLELNHDLLSVSSRPTDLNDGETNKLDSDRLFQMNKSNRKKIPSSTSSTTTSSATSQTLNNQSNTAALLAKKKTAPYYTQKNPTMLSKLTGSNTPQPGRPQFK